MRAVFLLCTSWLVVLATIRPTSEPTYNQLGLGCNHVAHIFMYSSAAL